MRDVDVNFTTHFITDASSGITMVRDLKGKRVALGSRASMQAGLLPYYFLQQLGLDPANWKATSQPRQFAAIIAVRVGD
jgi:phosphonate transport system substrate-binding protein